MTTNENTNVIYVIKLSKKEQILLVKNSYLSLRSTFKCLYTYSLKDGLKTTILSCNIA